METTVYRVQDAQGRGPWKPGFSHLWVEHRRDHENLPSWVAEFGRVDQKALVGEHVGCACSTIEQLKRWFTETEYRWLRERGYEAVKITGRLLANSGVQCVAASPRPLSQHGGAIDLYPIAREGAGAVTSSIAS